ncbi:hypothetical protein ABIF96_007999 [Bradyrhizobium ottawaense]|uniref:hypothetical protein n=1 Tax=Bradyrhizobium ottawaense TaxID=931866 RepID=UPI00041BB8A9
MFWSNGLVGSNTTFEIVRLFWPVIDRLLGRVDWGRRGKAAAPMKSQLNQYFSLIASP